VPLGGAATRACSRAASGPRTLRAGDGARLRPPRSADGWSTFAINVSGCLAIGVVIAALVDRHRAPDWLRTGLVIGVVGGYTTFSTFAQEALDLTRAGRPALAAIYAVASVSLGMAAVLAGLAVGRAL